MLYFLFFSLEGKEAIPSTRDKDSPNAPPSVQPRLPMCILDLNIVESLSFEWVHIDASSSSSALHPLLWKNILWIFPIPLCGTGVDEVLIGIAARY